MANRSHKTSLRFTAKSDTKITLTLSGVWIKLRKRRLPATVRHRRLINRFVGRSTPNLPDLIIDCAAKSLPYALKLLPRIHAILAFECKDIDYAKQTDEKDKTKEKLAHVNLSPQPRAKWLAYAATFIERVSSDPPPLRTAGATKTRIAEDRLLLFMLD